MSIQAQKLFTTMPVWYKGVEEEKIKVSLEDRFKSGQKPKTTERRV
jgi:hypothetical protein